MNAHKKRYFRCLVCWLSSLIANKVTVVSRTTVIFALHPRG